MAFNLNDTKASCNNGPLNNGIMVLKCLMDLRTKKQLKLFDGVITIFLA